MSIDMYFVLGGAEGRFIADSSVDLIVTSPPYWKKRRYGLENEIGQERFVDDYIRRLVSICRQWKRILKRTGSIFINLGDTVSGGVLSCVPSRFASEFSKHFELIHHIIWAKTRSMPSPALKRLKDCSESIYHFSPTLDPYLNFEEFENRFGNCGSFWEMAPERTFGDHSASFPLELVERCAALCLPPGGVLYDPFCGSGTVFRLSLTDSSIKTIGSDLKIYERTREILTSSVQVSLF